MQPKLHNILQVELYNSSLQNHKTKYLAYQHTKACVKNWERVLSKHRPLISWPTTDPQAMQPRKVQNMDPWSMDPLCVPGPWSMDRVHQNMDQVHGPPIFTPPSKHRQTKTQMSPGLGVRYFQTKQFKSVTPSLWLRPAPQNSEWTNFFWSWCQSCHLEDI